MATPHRALAKVAKHALPVPRALRLLAVRHLLGRAEAHELRGADHVVISPAKSGRTWLRVMLTRFFQARHDLPEGRLLARGNLGARDRRIPSILFTHETLLREAAGDVALAAAARDRKSVLLVRHPADAAVSAYFHWRNRTTPWKRALKRQPADDPSMTLFDFVMREPSGLQRVVAFLNRWAGEAEASPNLLTVRYEDLRAAPEAGLERILDFLGHAPSADEVRDAVRYASLENMRGLETTGRFAASGRALRPMRGGHADAAKVRRGKVGGYRDYFTPDELARIDAYIEHHLGPAFGYGARLAEAS